MSIILMQSIALLTCIFIFCDAAFVPYSSNLRYSTTASWLSQVSHPPNQLFSVKSSSSQFSIASRLKRIASFTDWAKDNRLNFAGIEVSSADPSGLGLYATKPLLPNTILIQVPTKLTLSVESPTDYNQVMERSLFPSNPKAYRNAPWWACLSIQLNYYDKIQSNNSKAGTISMKPWIDTLPRTYETPIHWSESQLEQLHYRPMIEAVSLQKRTWKNQYDLLASHSPEFASCIDYDDFVWGCETARSRAFSGVYSGSAFNPIPFVTSAVLVALYLSLGLGSVEQAANGAALVVCASILNDFVIPKLLKVQKYVICPMIDMANHVGMGSKGNVAFEYFSDSFSLSVIQPGISAVGEEVCIQYGPRSNDQLLQYYGFVEKSNVHDIYILPPIREWDIGSIEVACGRKIGPGRLAKLDKAGLLGRESNVDKNPSTHSDAANEVGGVVLTRANGIDPAVIQALRALVSSNDEWSNAGEAIGNFAAPVSLENERVTKLALKRALQLELESKPTSIEEDENILKTYLLETTSSCKVEWQAVKFRLEKKKLLLEAINSMS